MDTIAAAVIGWIEFIVLGAFAAGVVAYGLAVYHPLKWGLYNYLTALRDYWIPGLASGQQHSRHFPIIEFTVALGALYYLGVVANATSYWMVEPVRLRVLDLAYVGADKSVCMPTSPGAATPAASSLWPAGNRASELTLQEALVLPLTHMGPTAPSSTQTPATPLAADYTVSAPPHEEPHFVSLLTWPWWSVRQSAGVSASVDLRCESFVESHNGPGQPLAGIASTLDHQIKFVRLLRGTALFALLAAIISAVKSCVVIATSPFWIPSRTIYGELVDERAAKLEDQTRIPAWKKIRFATFRVVLPQLLIILPASLVLYALAMGAYRTSEFEFARVLRNSGEQLQLILASEHPQAAAPVTD